MSEDAHDPVTAKALALLEEGDADLDEIASTLAELWGMPADEVRARVEAALEERGAKTAVDDAATFDDAAAGAPYRTPPKRVEPVPASRTGALVAGGVVATCAALASAWLGWRQASAHSQTSLLVGTTGALFTTFVVHLVVRRPREQSTPASRRRDLVGLAALCVVLAAATPGARALTAARHDALVAGFAAYLDDHAALASLLDDDEATLVRHGDGSVVRHLELRASRHDASAAVRGRGVVARRSHGALVVDFAQLYLPSSLAASAPDDVGWLAVMRVTLRHGWGYEESVLVRVEHFDVAFVDASTGHEVARLALEAMPPSRTIHPADRYEIEPAVLADELASALGQLRKSE